MKVNARVKSYILRSILLSHAICILIAQVFHFGVLTRDSHETIKISDRNLLERILILSRGSVEAAKTKIDKLLTSRGMMPELVLNKSVEEFEVLWEYGSVFIIFKSKIIKAQSYPTFWAILINPFTPK